MGWPALVAGRSTVLADLEHIVNDIYCSLHCMLDIHYHFVKSWISMVTSMKTTDCLRENTEYNIDVGSDSISHSEVMKSIFGNV